MTVKRLKKMLNGTLSICRRSDGNIILHVQDEDSRIEFLEVQIGAEEFGNAVTGLSNQECSFSLRGTDYVGKVVQTEERKIVCPLSVYRARQELEDWLELNAQEDGWLLSTYLGSQGSVRSNEKDGSILKYHVTRYVDKPEGAK